MQKNYKRNVLVIGGGASGIMSAIVAAESGASVTIIEKNERIGKKILITGNGRCNITNKNISIENYHGHDPSFAMKVIELFNQNRTMDFFKNLGVEFYEEEGKIFPFSQQASSILNLLRLEIERLRIPLVLQTEISTLMPNTDETIEIFDRYGKSYQADAVIIACGGKAAPFTGSNGGGYKLAESLGHTITKVFPALVQLKLEGNLHQAMEKMFWEGEVFLFVNDKKIKSVKGDILFTSYGISGMAILKISREAIGAFLESKKVELHINFLPDISFNEKVQLLKKRKENHPERTLENFLTGWINTRIGQTLIKATGLKLNEKASDLTEKDIIKIAKSLEETKFLVTGDTGWNNAQITAGGISTEEIDPYTMESRIVKNVHFCGEIVDIDGDCGGYNLQWAWSSGFVAGKAASKLK